MSDVDDCGPCHDHNGLCPVHAEDRGYFRGRDEERAAIVAYLKREAAGCDTESTATNKWRYYAAALATAADQIEHGEHLEDAQHTRKG